ncbi:YveK family protein [Clostridium disporicum]|uniref:Capsular polysaccharide biosynthsis protein n=1 Tax=Clostridium disporicum TaxID=84024 RepID=A0A174KY23_9CLOT|nr:Wzz/FepE/Etk N-terminal domain-containing protein [Clostridium disporicum]CUP16922.1 capsular polysaccharide biosynthsis protein [Clostridium disporicum]
MEEQVISIEEIFAALKKRWKMIALITILATVVSGILSFFVIEPVYEASTKVFIGKEESSEEGYNSSDIQMYQKLLKTYSEAIKTRDLIDAAIKDSGYDLTTGQVSSGLTVTPITDTQILQIKYQSLDPKECEVVLKSISKAFVKTATDLVPNGNVRIIEGVELPKNPISPNKKMNIAIAFLLGLMVSVGLVFLLEYMDNSYKTKEQLENELEIPVLGVIPNLDEV